MTYKRLTDYTLTIKAGFLVVKGGEVPVYTMTTEPFLCFTVADVENHPTDWERVS